MARTAKLKVYRTPIGLHDAYVAAASQKAAIEAWGSDKDIFSRGRAELVTDPALATEPLESPGKVIRRLRGTAAEQIAALGHAEKEPAKPAKRGRRPSRTALDTAQSALAAAETRHRKERDGLAKREAALERERRALERQQAKEMEALRARLDKADAGYREARRRWRG